MNIVSSGSESLYFDVEAVLEDCSLMTQRLLGDQLATTKLEVCSALKVLMQGNQLLGDQGRLESVMTNLTNNARRFVNDKGTITISATQAGEVDDADVMRILFAVKDTGCGIAPEDHEKIFEDQQQGSNLSNQRDGELCQGMGLHNAWQSVKAMGGTLAVESELDKGARFYFTVPMCVVPKT